MPQKILIVDDSRTSRLFIQQALEIAGLADAEFHQAANGHEALSKLQADGPFTMMVTDINMPGKGGIELIHDIKSLAIGEMKIIVISSTQSTIRDAALKEMGVLEVLEKPINMPKIIKIFAPFKAGA